MPRKLFPQITRQGVARLSQYDQAYISTPLHRQGLTSRGLFGETTTAGWRRQMGHGRKENRALLYFPVNNGENHALSITVVLDLLLRIDHDAYVSPAGITKLLNEEYGHLVQFDPYTVGRILSGLLDAMGSIPADLRPLGKVSWSGARMVVVRWDSERAWRWLGAARTTMGDRAERDQIRARGGAEVPRAEVIWNLLDGLWEGLSA